MRGRWRALLLLALLVGVTTAVRGSDDADDDDDGNGGDTNGGDSNDGDTNGGDSNGGDTSGGNANSDAGAAVTSGAVDAEDGDSNGGATSGAMDVKGLESTLKSGGAAGLANMLSAIQSMGAASSGSDVSSHITKDADGNEVYDFRSVAGNANAPEPTADSAQPTAASSQPSSAVPTSAGKTPEQSMAEAQDLEKQVQAAEQLVAAAKPEQAAEARVENDEIAKEDSGNAQGQAVSVSLKPVYQDDKDEDKPKPPLPAAPPPAQVAAPPPPQPAQVAAPPPPQPAPQKRAPHPKATHAAAAQPPHPAPPVAPAKPPQPAATHSSSPVPKAVRAKSPRVASAAPKAQSREAVLQPYAEVAANLGALRRSVETLLRATPAPGYAASEAAALGQLGTRLDKLETSFVKVASNAQEEDTQVRTFQAQSEAEQRALEEQLGRERGLEGRDEEEIGEMRQEVRQNEQEISELRTVLATDLKGSGAERDKKAASFLSRGVQKSVFHRKRRHSRRGVAQ